MRTDSSLIVLNAERDPDASTVEILRRTKQFA
jgi:hypothetical protein